MGPTMHGYRQTKFLARYVLQGGYNFETRFDDICFVITDIFLCSWTKPLHFNPLDKDT